MKNKTQNEIYKSNFFMGLLCSGLCLLSLSAKAVDCDSTAITSMGHSVTFLGVSYSSGPDGCLSTWTYEVVNSDDAGAKDISHILFGSSTCIECLDADDDLYSISDPNYDMGPDPSIGDAYCGVKFDTEYNDPGETRVISFTLNGAYKIGTITFVAKAGPGYTTAEVCGPVCEAPVCETGVWDPETCGCESEEVPCSDIPDAIITPDATEICEGTKVILTANAGDGYTYQWYKNDAEIPGAKNISYKTKAAGVYTVKVSAASGCYSISEGVTITVLPQPHLSLSKPYGVDLCLSGEVLLEVSTAPGSTFQWYFNGSIIPGATENTLTVTEAGSYYSLVTNSYGCKKKCKGVNVVNSCRISGDAGRKTTFDVYPNPTLGMVNLSIAFADYTHAKIELANMGGQLLYSEIINEDARGIQKEFDLSEYPKGVYFVSIITETQKITKKIVLQ